jgi:DNA-binding XRE family transcriptional regulator
MGLGEKILEYRARHGLSQEEFANLVQVNVMTINAIENNKRKPLRTTAKKIEMIMKESENHVEG